MTSTFFEILSPLPLNRKEDARRLIGLWAEIAPNILPDRAGTHEPLKRRFSIADLGGLLDGWEYQVLFKRVSKPKLHSSVFMQYGPHRRHSSWTISIDDPQNLNLPSVLNLLNRASTEFSADFAFIHKPTKYDIETGLASSSKKEHQFICYHTSFEEVYPRYLLGDYIRKAVCRFVFKRTSLICSGVSCARIKKWVCSSAIDGVSRRLGGRTERLPESKRSSKKSP
jgi:hypothetical protein